MKNKLYEYNGITDQFIKTHYQHIIDQQIREINDLEVEKGVTNKVGSKLTRTCTAEWWRKGIDIVLKLCLEVLPCETGADEGTYTCVDYEVLAVYHKIYYHDLEYYITYKDVWLETNSDMAGEGLCEFYLMGNTRKYYNYNANTKEFYKVNLDELETQQQYKYSDFDFDGIVFEDGHGNKQMLSNDSTTYPNNVKPYDEYVNPTPVNVEDYFYLENPEQLNKYMRFYEFIADMDD